MSKLRSYLEAGGTDQPGHPVRVDQVGVVLDLGLRREQPDQDVADPVVTLDLALKTRKKPPHQPSCEHRWAVTHG